MTRPERPNPEPPGPDPVDALLRAAGEQFRSRVTPLEDVLPDTGRVRRGWIAAGVAAAVVALMVAGSTLAQRRPTGQPATPAPTAAPTAASSAPSGTDTGRLDIGAQLQSARWAESGSALDVTLTTPSGCSVDLVADPERVDPVVLTVLPRGTACRSGQTAVTERVSVPLRVDPTIVSRVVLGGSGEDGSLLPGSPWVKSSASVEVPPRSAPVETPGALVERDVVPAADGVLSVAPPAETTSAVWAGWEVATGRLLIGVRGPGCAAAPGAIAATAADRLEVTVAQPSSGVDQSCNAPQWRFAVFLPPDGLDRDAKTVVTVKGTAGSGAGGHSVTLPPLRPVLLGTLEGSPSWTGVTAQLTNGQAPEGTSVRWNPLLRQLAVTTVLESCGSPAALVEGRADGPLAVLVDDDGPDDSCGPQPQQVTALVQLPQGPPYGSAAFPVTVLDGSSSAGPEFTVPETTLQTEITVGTTVTRPVRDRTGQVDLPMDLHDCESTVVPTVVQVSATEVVVERPPTSTGPCRIATLIPAATSVRFRLAPGTDPGQPLTVIQDGERLVLPGL